MYVACASTLLFPWVTGGKEHKQSCAKSGKRQPSHGHGASDIYPQFKVCSTTQQIDIYYLTVVNNKQIVILELDYQAAT